MLDNALQSHRAILQQHRIARSSAHSINNARRVARATCNHRRLVNPGSFLIQGESPHPYYINAEVTDVDTGEDQAFHFDHRHRSPAWI